MPSGNEEIWLLARSLWNICFCSSGFVFTTSCLWLLDHMCMCTCNSHCHNTRHVCKHSRAEPTNAFPLQLQCTYAGHGIARRCAHKSPVNAEVESAVWAWLNLQKSSKFIIMPKSDKYMNTKKNTWAISMKTKLYNYKVQFRNIGDWIFHMCLE